MKKINLKSFENDSIVFDSLMEVRGGSGNNGNTISGRLFTMCNGSDHDAHVGDCNGGCD